jgi:hypothetical protein
LQRSFDDIDEVVNDAVLQSHENIEVAQSDIHVHKRDTGAGVGERDAYVG